MITAKSEATKLLEEILGGPLTFAGWLTSIRQCDGYTRKSLAKKLGITVQHLCDIEKGRRCPSPARAYRWGELLGYHGPQAMRLAVQTTVQRSMATIGVTVKQVDVSLASKKHTA